ncbi:MAG: hypothetical protein H6557_33525 [Lewinellaceae bacterium]|nr:hypothetical protein [Lewinellaceae bacterium]
MNALIHQVYDPKPFAGRYHELVDLLAEHLKAVQDGGKEPAIPLVSAEEEYAFWQKDLQENQGRPRGIVQVGAGRSVRVQHPRYMGHQISPAAPLAALVSLVDGMLNNGMGVYEMGAAGTTIERLVVKTIAQKMGFDGAVDGVLTSGGTLPTSPPCWLPAVSRRLLPFGRITSGKNWYLLVSEEAHYCVDR